MPERDFSSLERQLLDGGVTPARARRIADELTEHWHDLCEEAMAHGLADGDIEGYADERVGREADIANAILLQRDLRCWLYRYPKIARLALPLACYSLLPAAPIAAGVSHAPLLARWGACLGLSALFTSALMLVLYLAILGS